MATMTLGTNKDPKKAGWAKLIGGFLLMLLGALGIIFGRTLKKKILRIAVLLLSVVSFGGGFYLFIDGAETVALGVMDQMVLTDENLEKMAKGEISTPLTAQTMIFPGPNFMEWSYGPLMKQLPNLRRLRYECPDGSKNFTVYFTRLGVFGIPKESFVCKNGFVLVNYNPSKGFVSNMPSDELKK